MYCCPKFQILAYCGCVYHHPCFSSSLQIVLQPHRKAKDLYGNNNQSDGLVEFGRDVRPICTLPQADYPLNKLTQYHCEISGWGMTEYNNSNSYPDSVRAARITVGDVSETFCNYLYKWVSNCYGMYIVYKSEPSIRKQSNDFYI